MNLRDFIGQIQELDRQRPGMDVFFEKAENKGNGFEHSPLVFLIARSENGRGHCLISLGERAEDVQQYKEFLEIQKAQFPVRH